MCSTLHRGDVIHYVDNPSRISKKKEGLITFGIPLTREMHGIRKIGSSGI